MDKKALKSATEKALKAHHLAIESFKSGVQYWIDCGVALATIKELLPHGEFTTYITKNIDITPQQARKYIRCARQAPALLALINKHGAMSQDNALKLLPAADKSQLGYVGAIPNEKKGRDPDNWHTPPDIIDAARRVMGEIDLDPFSSAEANQVVKAKNILTKEDNAIEADWGEINTVFVNPPYGRGVMSDAAERIVEQYRDGKFREGVVLVNNATDAGWWHLLADVASAICVTRGRIAFLSPAEDGVLKEVSSNTRGQILFYFGENVSAFFKEYAGLGKCIRLENEKG